MKIDNKRAYDMAARAVVPNFEHHVGAITPEWAYANAAPSAYNEIERVASAIRLAYYNGLAEGKR